MIRWYITFIHMFMVRLMLAAGFALIASPAAMVLWDVTVGALTGVYLSPWAAIGGMLSLIVVALAVQSALHIRVAPPEAEPPVAEA